MTGDLQCNVESCDTCVSFDTDTDLAIGSASVGTPAS